MENKPYYTAIVALSIDGKIAQKIHHMSDWTSPEDKKHLHQILDQAEVIVVGNTTYTLARKPLSKRNCIVLTRSVTNNMKVNEKLLLCNPNVQPLKVIIRELKYKNVCILGGTQTYSHCLTNNLIDELFITIEPIIFGDGLPLFSLPHKCKWKLKRVTTLNTNGTLLIQYTKEKITL